MKRASVTFYLMLTLRNFELAISELEYEVDELDPAKALDPAGWHLRVAGGHASERLS